MGDGCVDLLFPLLASESRAEGTGSGSGKKEMLGDEGDSEPAYILRRFDPLLSSTEATSLVSPHEKGQVAKGSDQSDVGKDLVRQFLENCMDAVLPDGRERDSSRDKDQYLLPSVLKGVEEGHCKSSDDL